MIRTFDVTQSKADEFSVVEGFTIELPNLASDHVYTQIIFNKWIFMSTFPLHQDTWK
jgi:hypothetical protein